MFDNFTNILALITDLETATKNLDPFNPATLTHVKILLSCLNGSLDSAQELMDGIRDQVSAVEQMIAICER
jgi:hypothetical protein